MSAHPRRSRPRLVHPDLAARVPGLRPVAATAVALAVHTGLLGVWTAYSVWLLARFVTLAWRSRGSGWLRGQRDGHQDLLHHRLLLPRNRCRS